MRVPEIHRHLTRDDLAILTGEISRLDRSEGRKAREAVNRGDIDTVLDSDAALQAVLGRGGPPGAISLPVMWYVPIRAELKKAGEKSIALADYVAGIPVLFSSPDSAALVTKTEPMLHTWLEGVERLPSNTVAQAERAVEVAALAIWWSGCFPERVTGKVSEDSDALRAYHDLASQMFNLVGRIMSVKIPTVAAFYLGIAARTTVIGTALACVSKNFLGPAAHSPNERLNRFLGRLEAI
jgi:hypothetical protein